MTFRERRSTTSGTLRLLAAAATLALIVTGCSSGASTTDATTATAAGESGRSAPSSARDRAVRFAECMRKNGVDGFPDPNADGELTVDGVLNGSSIDPDGLAWKQALSACQELQPSGFTGHQRNAEQQRTALAFAQCIRENGVADFPDPTPDAPLVDTNRIPSTARDGNAALNAAMRKCGAVYGEKLGVKAP